MKKEKTLKLKHKIGYGLGDCGGVMTFALMSSTFSMYLSQAFLKDWQDFACYLV